MAAVAPPSKQALITQITQLTSQVEVNLTRCNTEFEGIRDSAPLQNLFNETEKVSKRLFATLEQYVTLYGNGKFEGVEVQALSDRIKDVVMRTLFWNYDIADRIIRKVPKPDSTDFY